MGQENILVFDRTILDMAGVFQGFTPKAGEYLDAIFSGGVEFRPRDTVEEDPSYKQIIPYCVIVADGQVFQYTRGKAGNEARLHAKRSIGVGGHVDEADMHGAATLQTLIQASLRELAEEVVFGTLPLTPARIIGLVNDDSNPVGRVHLGVVMLVKLEEPKAKSNEDALRDAGFVTIEEAMADIDAYETWSQLVLPYLS